MITLALLALLARSPVDSFVVDSFRFESGVTVPNIKIVYATYGHLDAARDNAVLAPSHYMADHNGYNWLLGPGQALDTTRYFVIATEMFGNGTRRVRAIRRSRFMDPGFRWPRFATTSRSCIGC